MGEWGGEGGGMSGEGGGVSGEGGIRLYSTDLLSLFLDY